MGERFNPFKRYNGIYIPDGVYNYKILTPVSKIVYGRLLRFSGKDGRCNPKQETIAEDMGIHVNTVSNAISLLEKEGFIDIEKGNRRKHEPDTYFFLEHERLGTTHKNCGSEPTKNISCETTNIVGREPQTKCVAHIEESHYEESHLRERERERESSSFLEKVFQFLGKYSRNHLQTFFEFWSEKDENGIMRYQKQDSWELSKRLSRWKPRNVNKGEKSNTYRERGFANDNNGRDPWDN